MKNCEVYHDEYLYEFIGTLWVSNEFKEAFKTKHPFLNTIIKKACRYPIFFYKPSDPVERSHFSTWWRHIPIRNYNNPIVNDLYYLHELSHLANMDPTIFTNPSDFGAWVGAMITNEFVASMDSEVFVYLHFPTIRAKTFNFEIWVDRFLKQGAIATDDWMNRLCQERNAVLYGNKKDCDDIEKYIQSYAGQNQKWTRVWKTVFYRINRQLMLFQTLFDSTKKDFARNCILDVLRFYLEDHTVDGVPFWVQAHAFNDILRGKVKTDFKV